MLEGYRSTLNGFVGPTEVLCCGNTVQVKDYSKYDWTLFNPAEKLAHRESTFDSYLSRARELGKGLCPAE